MPDKSELASGLNEIFGVDFSWTKMAKEELAILHNFLSNPKLVVMTFAEKMEPAERTKVLTFLNSSATTPAAAAVSVDTSVPGNSEGVTGGVLPLVDEILERRPLLRKLFAGEGIIGGGLR